MTSFLAARVSCPLALAVTLAFAPGALAEEPPYPLPTPKAAKPAPDEVALKDLATRLCEAIDAGDAAGAARAIAEGANPDVGMGAGKDSTRGRTPLIHAVLAGRTELVDLLLAHGARLEVGDAARHTPLMYAVLAGKLDLAKHLVRAGARLDAKDQEEATAVDYVKKGDEATAKWLAETAKLHAELFRALEEKDPQRAWNTVEAGASPNANDGKTSVLMSAVSLGDLELVKKALKGGSRPDALHMQSFVIETPLGLAAAKGSLELLRTLLSAGAPNRYAADDALSSAAGSELPDRAERVKLLLAAGARATHETLLQAPLPNAARRGDLQVMALLLEAGADQSAVNHALESACDADTEEKALPVVRALLAIGADPDYDHLFTTALGNAAEHGHLRVLEVLLPRVNDESLNSAVAQAARTGKAPGLKWLCEHGGKRINFAFKPGLYPASLNAAIEKGYHDCLEILIAAGADVNHEPEAFENPPLIEAVARKDKRSIELLLAAGADPRKEWKQGIPGGKSALAQAKEGGDEGVLALLTGGPAGKGQDPLGATLLGTSLVTQDLGKFHKVMYTDAETRRSQTVHIRKSVDEFGSLRVQEVYSLCYDSRDPPSEDMLRTVFQKRFGIGGLILEPPNETQQNWRIRFRVPVSCTTTGERLVTVLAIVQSTADSLEAEINPGVEDRL